MSRDSNNNRPMGATEWLLLIALSMLWGGTFFCTEIALDEVQPCTLVLGRVGIAALALLAAVHASGTACRAKRRCGSRSWSWAR